MVDDVLTGRRQWAAVVTMASMVFCVGLGTQQAPPEARTDDETPGTVAGQH